MNVLTTKMNSGPRILFYSHHSVGIGHYVRTVQLISCLKDFDIYFINGGEELKDFLVLQNVKILNLPPVDPEFQPEVDAGDRISCIMKERTKMIDSLFRKELFDIFVTEYFPFGRWYFRNELLPILERIKLSSLPKPKVICSLRDIPLEGYINDKSYGIRCSAVLNTYFDHLLVHSDPTVFHLRDVFNSWQHIKISVIHTGYVSQKEDQYESICDTEPLSLPTKSDEKLILVTAGSGSDQYNTYDFLLNVIRTKDLLDQTVRSKFLIFAGNFLSEENLLKLQDICHREDIIVRRFSSRILSWMRRADISVSRGGYNTCMNILETEVKAIVIPVRSSGDQHTRIARLEKLDLVTKIGEDEFSPQMLCNQILETLKKKKHTHNIDLDGAQKTAAFLTDLLTTH